MRLLSYQQRYSARAQVAKVGDADSAARQSTQRIDDAVAGRIVVDSDSGSLCSVAAHPSIGAAGGTVRAPIHRYRFPPQETDGRAMSTYARLAPSVFRAPRCPCF